MIFNFFIISPLLLKSLYKICEQVIKLYDDIYLCKTAHNDIENLYVAHQEKYGVFGMIWSINWAYTFGSIFVCIPTTSKFKLCMHFNMSHKVLVFLGGVSIKIDEFCSSVVDDDNELLKDSGMDALVD